MRQTAFSAEAWNLIRQRNDVLSPRLPRGPDARVLNHHASLHLCPSHQPAKQNRTIGPINTMAFAAILLALSNLDAYSMEP